MKLKNIIITLVLIFIGCLCLKYVSGKVFNEVKSGKVANHINRDILSEKDKLHGIDLSHHNSGINWADLDVDFVYLKATEGATYVDRKFKQYRDRCLANNIPVGAYHFFTTSSSGQAQFDNFKRIVGNSTNLIPVIDIEVNKNKWSRKKLLAEIITFIRLCREEYGVTPMIYTSDWFYTFYFKFSEVDDVFLWLGGVNVKRWLLLNSHIMHQYATERVKGIDNPVDCNALYVPIDSILMAKSWKVSQAS